MEKTYKKIEDMSYEEFSEYCNDRACDGRWGMNEAMNCIAIIETINAIKVKIFGITRKKATKQAREEAWQVVVASMIENAER